MPISTGPEDLGELERMLKRIMVAVVCIPLIFVIFFLLPDIALPIAIAILSALAVYEALWTTGFAKNPWLVAGSMLLAGAIPFWVYWGEDRFVGLCALLAYFCLIFIVAISSKYKVTTEKLCGAFFFTAFISYFLSSFVRLNALDGGKYFILLPLVAAFLSDAFALFAGMLFGRHKLAPTLSPKKTVEGSIGGLIGAVGGMLIYGVVMQQGYHLEVNYLLLAVYGLLGSAISQLGDLSFSYIKRQSQIKDFGNIFPGHGGVLDRFDSVIFCGPLMEILIRLIPAIVTA